MYSQAIIGTHCFVPSSELKNGVSEAKRRLTAVSKYEEADGSHKSVALYAERNGLFGVPRYYFQDIPATDIIYQDCIGSPVTFKFRSSKSHPKYPMQQSLVGRFKRYVRDGKTGFVIVARTGTGKTCIGLECIQLLGRTALIIVPKEDLLGQWTRRIKKHTDIKNSDVGIIQQDRCEFQGKKIVIAMMHSLALRKRPYPEELYSYFGTVVVDESHRVGAAKLGSAPMLFSARYRIGMSATPKRKDGMDIVLRYHFGEVWLSATDDDLPVPTIVVKHLTDTPPVKFYPGASFMARRAKTISSVSKDPSRNMRIASYVNAMYTKDRKIVVFSDRLQQLDTIRHFLLNTYRIPSNVIGKYIGGVKDSERVRIATDCKILLATYQSMDMGTDIPSLDALVFATPRSDVVQPIGRILRFVRGKKRPVVLDLVDTSISDCIVMAKARERKYAELGYTITKI